MTPYSYFGTTVLTMDAILLAGDGRIFTSTLKVCTTKYCATSAPGIRKSSRTSMSCSQMRNSASMKNLVTIIPEPWIRVGSKDILSVDSADSVSTGTMSYTPTAGTNMKNVTYAIEETMEDNSSTM